MFSKMLTRTNLQTIFRKTIMPTSNNFVLRNLSTKACDVNLKCGNPTYVSRAMCRRIVGKTTPFPLPVYRGRKPQNKAEFGPWYAEDFMKFSIFFVCSLTCIEFHDYPVSQLLIPDNITEQSTTADE